MSFRSREEKQALTSKSKQWHDWALGCAREKGPDENGVVGYIIRRHETHLIEEWVEWCRLNGFFDQAKSIPKLVSSKAGWQAPCENTSDFEIYLANFGQEYKALPPKIRRKGTFNRAAKRNYNPHPDAHRRAVEMCRSAIGRQARSEGWWMQLYEFYRDVGDQPTKAERLRLMAQARRVARSFDKPLPAQFAELGQMMKERRDKIEAEIFAA